MGGALGHPAAAATRTEPPPLAGERHQVLTGAALAPKARHAALEGATHQELPELPLDELREARAVARLRGRAQESLQMHADDLMEHGVLGVSRTIHGLCTRHPLGYRASSSAPMPRDGYTRSRALDVTTVAI
jgi:non-ribosomal peptide synthetase component F